MLDVYMITQSIMYRSAVRLDAYADRIKIQHMHAASPHEHALSQQPPSRNGPIDFIFGGLLDTSPEEPTRELPRK